MKEIKTTTAIDVNNKPQLIRFGLVAVLQNDGLKIGIPNRPDRMGEYDNVNSWVVDDLTELLELPKKLGSKIDVLNTIAAYSDHEVEDGKIKMGKIAQKYWFDAANPLESEFYGISMSARPMYRYNPSDGSYSLKLNITAIKTGEPYATRVKDLKDDDDTIVIDGIVFE